jgi:hypothetical protein
MVSRKWAWTIVGLLLAACGSYRYVYRNQNGGTIALQGDRDSAMEKARDAMKDHCRGPYTITEEGEVVVGSETEGRAESHENRRGGVTTHEGQITQDVREWRVTYVCGYVAPGGAPPPINPNQPGWNGGQPGYR